MKICIFSWNVLNARAPYVKKLDHRDARFKSYSVYFYSVSVYFYQLVYFSYSAYFYMHYIPVLFIRCIFLRCCIIMHFTCFCNTIFVTLTFAIISTFFKIQSLLPKNSMQYKRCTERPYYILFNGF